MQTYHAQPMPVVAQPVPPIFQRRPTTREERTACASSRTAMRDGASAFRCFADRLAQLVLVVARSCQGSNYFLLLFF